MSIFALASMGVILFFAALAVFCGIMKGKKYIWEFSAARLVTVVISVVFSVIAASLVAHLLGEILFDVLRDSAFDGFDVLRDSAFDESELLENISALPSAADVFSAIIAIIVAPLLFFIFFMITKPLFALLVKPLTRLLMKLTKVLPNSKKTNAKGKKIKNAEFRSEKKFDTIGAVVGAVCGLVIFVAIVAPLMGTLGTVNHTVQTVGGSEHLLPDVVLEISDGVADNVGAKAVRLAGGNLIYKNLTTYKVNGEKMSLDNELNYISSITHAVLCYKHDESTPEEKADAFRVTADSFGNTKVIPTVVAEFVSEASSEWSAGEEYAGLPAPSVGKVFDPTLREIYAAFSDSTPDSIRTDYRTIINSVALVIEHDVVDEFSEGGDKLHMFENEELISGIMLEILENEHLAPSIEGFTNAGLSLVADALDVYEDQQALYDGFMNDMKSAYDEVNSYYGSSYAKLNDLTDDVKSIYDRYGLEISDGVAECVAMAMLENEDLDDVDSYKDFFSANSVSISVSNEAPNVVTPLSVKSPQWVGQANIYANKFARVADEAADLEEYTESIKAMLNVESAIYDDFFDEEKEEFAKNVASKLYAASQSEKGVIYNTAVFSTPEELKAQSVRLTKDQMKVTIDNVTDNEREAKALARALASAVEISDQIDTAGDNTVEVLKSFGPVLDHFADSETIGTQGTANLVTAIFESDTVRGNVGFSVIQAGSISHVINNGVEKGRTYNELLKSVGQMVDVVQISSDKGDSTEKVKELMQDITPESAEVLKEMTTPETMKNYGVPDENAQKVSDVMSDMFGQMSDAKESGMSDEQYHQESLAVSDMMNIAMQVGESDKDSTMFGGEDSATGITPTEYVDRVMASTVISNTIVNASYDAENDTIVNNPLGMARDLTEDESDELVSSLDAKWQEKKLETSDPEELKETEKLIGSIGAILGIELQISDAGVALK